MVNTSADDVDTMVDDQPIVLPEQGQEMSEPRPQRPAPAPRPQTPEPRPRQRTPETHPLSGLQHLGIVTPRKRRPAVPTFQEAEAAGNTTDVDVNQQLLIESAGGHCLSDVPLPHVPLQDVPLPDIPLPDVPLPDVPVPEVRPDGSVGEERTSPHVVEVAMVVAFGLGSGSCLVHFHCSNLFISGFDYYTRHEVFGSLKVYFIYGFCTGCICIGFSLFIVLWDIGHTACLQLLACNKPPCDGVEAESIVSLHMRLLGPSTNFRPFLRCMLHSSCVVDNAREDPYPLPLIYMPKEVIL
jgi:hypothetical protein